MTGVLPGAVILPLLGAALAVLFRGLPLVTRIVSLSALGAQLLLDVALVIITDDGTPVVMWLGGWSDGLGITLVADRFASILMLTSTFITLAVLVYAISQHRDVDPDDESTTAFHPAMLLMAAGVSNAFVAGDLFNLFVSFEILLTASYVLLTLGGTGERVRAGAPYIVVSLLSSIVFLAAIALVYAATGTVNMAALAGRIGDLPDGTAQVLQALLLVAFGIKAAIWPMSAWLPDSYPNAPAPVSAVFAGLLTKVGIYAIIRTHLVLFGGEGFDSVMMWAALATMLVGIAGAVVQSDIKRLLSFTLVSHIGYLLFGVAIGSAAGLAATVYYMVHHILVQTALFLAAGLIEHLRGTTDVARLGGLARAAPLLAIAFFVPAMNLAGIPPLSGFLGKIGLFQAGLADGGALTAGVVAGGTVTSLLTLYAVIRVWGRAFWRPTPVGGVHEDVQQDGDVDDGAMAERPLTAMDTGEHKAAAEPVVQMRPRRTVAVPTVEGDEAGMVTVELPPDLTPSARPDVRWRPRMPIGMIAATFSVVLAGIALTIVGGPLYDLANRTGTDLIQPDQYVSIVMGQP